MTEYGFTPGPWTFQWNGNRDWTDGEVARGDDTIAVVCGTNQGQWREANDDGNAEFAANTRLIAASPTLLEVTQKALQFAVLTLAFHGRDRGTDRQEQKLNDLEKLARELDDIARAAITFATGKDA